MPPNGSSAPCSRSHRSARRARWLTRIGRLMWELVEVATPRRLRHVLFRYWAPTLIVVAVLLIVGGAALGAPATAKAGWVLLGFLAGLKALVWATGDIVRARGR